MVPETTLIFLKDSFNECTIDDRPIQLICIWIYIFVCQHTDIDIAGQYAGFINGVLQHILAILNYQHLKSSETTRPFPFLIF